MMFADDLVDKPEPNESVYTGREAAADRATWEEHDAAVRAEQRRAQSE